MADEKTEEKTEEKTKKTVPGMERSFKGIAKHVDDVLDLYWDKEKRSFRDPFTCWLALFTYARLLANLTAEAEERIEKRTIAFEKRVAEFETRLTTMERWKAEAEAMTAQLVKEAEKVMMGGEPPNLRQIIEDKMPSLVEGSIVETPKTETVAEGPVESSAPAPKPALVSMKPEPNGEKKGNKKHHQKDDVA